MSDFNYKALSKQFHSAIAKEVEPYGFVQQKGKDNYLFFRKTDLGRDIFQAGTGNKRQYMNVMTFAGIRVEELQVFLSEFKRIIDPAYKNRAATMATELGNIVRGENFIWEIWEESDIPQVVTEVMEKFREIALPFFESFSTLEEIYGTISRIDPVGWQYGGFPVTRSEDAIGMAFMMGKYDQIDPLFARSWEYLNEIEDPNLDRFADFEKWLREKLRQKTATVESTG